MSHSMKRTLTIIGGAALAIGLVAAGPRDIFWADHSADLQNPASLAFRFNSAGTYYGTFFEDGEEGQGISTINADGTFHNNDVSDQSMGGLYANEGLGQGSWVQTGNLTATGTSINFAFDEIGVPLGIVRSTMYVTLAPDFDSFNGTYISEAFYIDQDPTDPDEVPFDTSSGTFSFNRLAAEY